MRSKEQQALLATGPQVHKLHIDFAAAGQHACTRFATHGAPTAKLAASLSSMGSLKAAQLILEVHAVAFHASSSSCASCKGSIPCAEGAPPPLHLPGQHAAACLLNLQRFQLSQTVPA